MWEPPHAADTCGRRAPRSAHALTMEVRPVESHQPVLLGVGHPAPLRKAAPQALVRDQRRAPDAPWVREKKTGKQNHAHTWRVSDRSSQLHSACAGPHCQHAELAVHRERSVGGRQVGGATPRLGLSLIAHHSSPSPPSAGPVRVVAPQPGRSRVIPISCARLQRPQRCPGQAPALCRSQGVTAGGTVTCSNAPHTEALCCIMGCQLREPDPSFEPTPHAIACSAGSAPATHPTAVPPEAGSEAAFARRFHTPHSALSPGPACVTACQAHRPVLYLHA